MKLVIPFLLIIAVVPTEAREVRLRLEEAPAYALAHNRDLRAARLRIDEARARLRGSGLMPNPALAGEAMQNTRSQAREVMLAFEQRFPITARLHLEKAISAREVAMAEAEVRDEERRLIAEVELLAVRVAAVQQLRTLGEKQAALSKELHEVALRRYETGVASAADSSQLLIESTQAELDLRQLDADRVALVGELKPLLGAPAADGLVLTGALPQPPATTPVREENRADLQRARIEEEAAELGIRLARARRWDDLGLGVVVEGDRTAERRNEAMIGLRFSLPLPLWDQNQGEIGEKTVRRARAEQERDALAFRIAHEAAAARSEMAAYAQLARETRDKLLPVVEQQNEQLESAYRVGEMDLVPLLRVREQRYRFEARLVESTRDYYLARARYRAATGTHPALKSSAVPRAHPARGK